MLAVAEAQAPAATEPAPELTVLSINEGALATAVLGHATAIQSFRSAFESAGVRAYVEAIPPLEGRALRLATGFPVLGRYDLDLQPFRWHVAEAISARRVAERRVAELRPDVLHVSSHTIGFLLGHVMRRVPTLLSVDVTVWDWTRLGIWRPVRPWTKATLAPSLALERRAFRQAARVIAWTRTIKAAVEEAEPAAHVVEHHPGLDLARFSPAEARRPDGRVRVLFVGGRFARKGGEDLLAALEPRLGKDVDVDLVTPDPVPPRPGVRVRRLDWSDPALVEAYREADVFCLPTYGDAVPWTVLEAMACGLPVVAGSVGSVPELLDDGGAGRLVQPGDRRALRSTLDELIDDPTLRSGIGQAARVRCEERYDAVRQARALVDLLRDVASTPR
jgi:glycosyltransferase involved in cell wall biosynthesis